jgi:hypothetical protein
VDGLDVGQDTKMNIPHLEFEIAELHEHVGDLLLAIRNGELSDFGEVSLSVHLGHLLDHIDLAWNLKDREGEEIANLSQNEFERAMNTVPNFGFNRHLSATLEYTEEAQQDVHGNTH